MILKWEDGTSGVSPTCFSTPASQPSILSWYVVEARAGEHDREHDGCHAPAGGVFIFYVYSRGNRLIGNGILQGRAQAAPCRNGKGETHRACRSTNSKRNNTYLIDRNTYICTYMC